MGRRGKLGAADELPLGCAQIDEDEVAGGQRVAVPLICVASLRGPAFTNVP